MKDLHSKLAIAELLPVATYAADNTPAKVDLLGFEAAEIALAIGVGGITFSGTNKIEFVLTASDDDSTYNAVTDNDMLGVTGITTGIIKSLVAAHAASEVFRCGYVGGKRYLKLLADFSGTHGTGTPLAASVVEGYAHRSQA
jgi:hypothetical protein